MIDLILTTLVMDQHALFTQAVSRGSGTMAPTRWRSIRSEFDRVSDAALWSRQVIQGVRCGEGVVRM
jgi:hypothetical protein